MLISALYIVKNGEHFLRQSMQSVAPFVDEIIVSDNMSTDSTLQIAKDFVTSNNIIQKDYTQLYGTSHSSRFINEDPILIHQKNDCLQQARGKWVLIMDDDEVYRQQDMLFLKKYAKYHDEGELRWAFLHFWKTPYQIITGHTWRMHPQRFYFKEKGMKYDVREDNVSLKDGSMASLRGYIFNKFIMCYHYSYLKPEGFIREKITRYMLRGNPNVIPQNVKSFVNKHPYFSNKFDSERYGADGLYCAGNAFGITEELAPVDLRIHPPFMIEKFKELSLL